MDMIEIYTDGSWNHKTKDMGIGICAKYIYHLPRPSKLIQHSAYIGKGTGNIAELTAIKTALVKMKKYKHLSIVIYSDSKYCIGVLYKNWNYKANIDLINSIKPIILEFDDLKFKWVKGHSTNKGNQIADKIAVAARKSQECPAPKTPKKKKYKKKKPVAVYKTHYMDKHRDLRDVPINQERYR